MVSLQVRTIPVFPYQTWILNAHQSCFTTTGDKAAEVFEPAKLPYEKLGHIWALADTKQRGVLDLFEFVVAMHLVVSSWKGLLRDLPPTLPPSLFEAAARRPSRSVSTDSRPSFAPPPGAPRPQSPMVNPQHNATLSPQSTGASNTARPPMGPLPSNNPSNTALTADWLITPNEKSRYDTVFSTVDRANSGFIVGEQAVEFFSKTGLSEDILAQIWDLSDIDSDGQLSRDEFAVAMHLIKQCRAHPKQPLPATIPSGLVPPSMRPPAPASSIPRAASATDDLLGLDVFGSGHGPTANAPSSNPTAPPAPTATAAPQTRDPTDALFGPASGTVPPSFPVSSATAPQGVHPSPAATHATASATSFKPFVPTSSFGQSLAPQLSGSGSQAGARDATSPKPKDADDLLDDVDPEESKKINPETADLANLSNQIGSLSTEMRSMQDKRVNKEQELSQSSAQKQDFENRLAQARIMYEHEVASFRALEESLKASRADTEAKQKEYLVLESQRVDLQTQTANHAAALEADTAENTSLKEKIKAVNVEIAQLKPKLEKLKAEAKQQRGFVAINQKQLGTVEGERDRLQGEADNTKDEIDELRDSAHAQEQASSPPPPPVPSYHAQSPLPTATSLPGASSWNPFFRKINNENSQRTVSPASPATAPPPADASSNSLQQQSLFDVFGPTDQTPPFRAASFHTASASPTPRVPTPPSAQSPLPALAPHQSSVEPNAESNSNISPSTGVQSPTAGVGAAPATQSRASGSATPEIYAPNPISAANISQSPTSLTPGQFPATTNQDKKDLSFDSFFDASGLSRHEGSPSNSSDAHDAFSSMMTEKKAGNDDALGGGFDFADHPPPSSAKGSAAQFEFPPIQELADDDDDNSSDEEAPKAKPPGSPPKEHSPPHQPVEKGEVENKPAEDKTAAHKSVESSMSKIDDDFDKAFVNLHLSTPKDAGESSDSSEDDDPFTKGGGSHLDLSFDRDISRTASALATQEKEKDDGKEEHK